MKINRRRSTFQERTLSALETAHFKSVMDSDIDVNVAPFDCLDDMPEEWQNDVRLIDLPTNGRVN